MTSRKRLLTVLGALTVLVLALSACADEGDEAGDVGDDAADPGDEGEDAADPGDEGEDAADPGDEEAAGESVDLELSTQSVPDDHHTVAMHEFAELVEERSDGRITATVHDSGSLMDQATEQTAIISGDVDIVYSSPSWLEEQVPEVGVVGVPFLIEDAEHLYAVHDSEVGQELYDIIVDTVGVRPLTSLYLGTRQLNLTDAVDHVETPDDLAGVNLRVPDAEAWIEMGQALGANPTPVDFGELYLALDTGTVDGQDNPLPTTRNADFYEVTSQIVLTGHLVDSVWPTINEDLWQSLDAEAQDLIVEAWIEARDNATEIALDAEAELVEFFEGEGLDVYEPDVEAFRERAFEIYLEDEERTSRWVEGMDDQIRDLAP